MASSTLATSTTRNPVTHTVAVGRAGFTIEPDVVLASVGDYITYNFYPTNHSVIRADYRYPCVPYELVDTSPGFFSGFKPVDAVLANPPNFTVQVNDTEPIFVYCGAPDSCNKQGMVAVVNPNATTSLADFRQRALQAQFVLLPGDKWPSEGGITTSAGPSSTSSTTTTTPTPTVTPTPTATPSPSTSLSPGAIAGIAIGGAAVLLIAAIALWICGRRSTTRSADSGGFLGFKSQNDAPQSGAATPATMPPAYPQTPAMIVPAGKGYPNSSIVEHYHPTGSPPPQMSPHYAQHAFPPHILDPAAFSHQPVYFTMPHHGSGLGPNMPPYTQELYSGTPAPRPAPSMGPPPVVVNPDTHSTSLSRSQHGNDSRGGSPDIVNEMNALTSQLGAGDEQQQGSRYSGDFRRSGNGGHWQG